MTLPFPDTSTDSYATKRRNWLGRYLDVERSMDQHVFNALTDAMVSVDESMTKLIGKETKSAATRRLQLALTHKEIRKTITDLYGNVGDTIKGFHGAAAEAAVEAAIADQKRLLAKIFTKQQVAGFEASLKQTATRNIESVMTRVLQTQQPLSKRVYRTKALSQGLVDRAINNGLARGDSFTNIAKDVKALINPNVPGGVSYAAKRLARTETNNAFHAQSIHDAQEMPWVTQMSWNLSKVHQFDPGDACEMYAQQRLFPVEAVPDKPHPHCRCFVVPEPVTDETFDHAVLGGQYDKFLDDFINGGSTDVPAPTPAKRKTKVAKMVPSLPDSPTTKAAQPKGWTGPLVAKPAANLTVRKVSDDLWLKHRNDTTFLQNAREGARSVQTKGYKGGLSSPGKQAILAQADSLQASKGIAFDIGREMAARVAYAPESTQSVFKALQLDAKQVGELYSTPGVSMPLSTFEVNNARALAENVLEKGKKTVVFEIDSGAKVATVGDSRLTMGHFQVSDIVEKNDPQGGKYWAVRLKQGDVREFEADTPKGKAIPNIELVAEAPGTPTVVPTPAPKAPEKPKVPPKPVASTLAARIDRAATHSEVAAEFHKDYPKMNLVNWDANHTNLHVLKEISTQLDVMMRRYPQDSMSHIEFQDTDTLGTAFAHVQAYPYSKAEKAKGRDGWSTRMRFSTAYTKDDMKAKEGKEGGVDDGFFTPGANAWSATTIHEYGHVLDFDTTTQTRVFLLDAIAPVGGYDKHAVNTDFDVRQKFVKWLGGNNSTTYLRRGINRIKFNGAAPSRYSVTDPTRLGFNEAEIIAESFTDVTMNGAKAAEVSKAVVDELMNTRRVYKRVNG